MNVRHVTSSFSVDRPCLNADRSPNQDEEYDGDTLPRNVHFALLFLNSNITVVDTVISTYKWENLKCDTRYTDMKFNLVIGECFVVKYTNP